MTSSGEHVKKPNQFKILLIKTPPAIIPLSPPHESRVEDFIARYFGIKPDSLYLDSDSGGGSVTAKDQRRLDCLEWLERSHYPLIILSEVDAPLKALADVRVVSPSSKILILSSSASIPEAVNAMQLGADDYLSIPLNPDLFQKAIRKAISRDPVFGNVFYLDDTTGLLNSRYLHELLIRELSRFRKTRRSFAILFIDVDRFKSVNDRFGHLAGNRVLKELGEHLKKQIREGDQVIRYGGDEFIVALLPSDLTTAEQVAERIRDSVEKKVFFQKGEIQVRCTVSIGVAVFPDHTSYGFSGEFSSDQFSGQAQFMMEFIEAADMAMYRAKNGSRNRIAVAKVPTVQPPEILMSASSYTCGTG